MNLLPGLPGDSESILALDLPAVARAVLRWMVPKKLATFAETAAFVGGRRGAALHDLCGIFRSGNPPADSLGAQREAVLCRALEAWAWLESTGLIVPFASTWNVRHIVTDRGLALAEAPESEWRDFSARVLLPVAFFHPSLRQTAYGALLRGEHQVAVFAAMLEVEKAVRRVAGAQLGNHVGVDLLRKAFAVAGPLADGSLQTAENEAFAHLYAGAYGAYRNPSAHREVEIPAATAIEVLVLASHLLRVVDDRVKAADRG